MVYLALVLMALALCACGQSDIDNSNSENQKFSKILPRKVRDLEEQYGSFEERFSKLEERFTTECTDFDQKLDDISSKLTDLDEKVESIDHYWVGLERDVHGAMDHWLDGSVVGDNSAMFQAGEPNNAGGSEGCAAMVEGEFFMNDDSCNKEFSFICEVPVN